MKYLSKHVHGGGGKRVERVFAIYDKYAFTLAEVLVTLGIIGVVSAMTIPTLMNQTNGKELQAGFKEAYSILSQAVVSVQNESMPGMKKFYATNTSKGYINASEIQQKIYSKLKIVGECNYKSPVRNYNKKKENPEIDRGNPTPDKALANGMCFNVHVNSGQINLSIDVNGTKAPNVLGHDIFFFDIDDNDSLHPKQSSEKVYTEEELEDKWGDYNNAYLGSQHGDPCSVKSNQSGNGLGCAYWALIDKNPDDNSKGYWESLP